MICSVGDCEGVNWARGWCQQHYDSWRRSGYVHRVGPGPAPKDWDRCGAGTDYGCGRRVDFPAHVIINGRKIWSGTEHVLVHPDCKPEGTRGVFMERLMAEIRARA